MKKLLSVLFAICMLLSLTACGGDVVSSGGSTGETSSAEGIDCSAENPYVMQFAFQETADYHSVVGAGAILMAEAIEEISGGAFKMELFGSGSLGSEVETFDGMQMGINQMAGICNATFANYIDALKIVDLPYIFSDLDVAYGILHSELIEQYYDEIYEQYGVKVLATGKSGFKNMNTTFGPVRTPADLAGKKIRALQADITIDAINYMGGSGLGMALSECVTGLQQGTIDGLDNPPAVVYNSATYTVAPYYSLTMHAFTPWSFCMARSEWEKMSEEQQGWWIEAANRAVEEQIAAADEIEAEAYEAMEAEGLIVIEDVDRDAFREAVQPMYEKYRDIIGSDFMDEVLTRIDELEGN